MGAVTDVPLPAGDDLQRPVTLLVELDHVLGGPRLAEQLTGVAEQVHDAGPRLPHGPAAEFGPQPRARAGEPVGGLLLQPAVPPQHRPDGQIQLAPPDDVGGVAERADHRDAGALARLRQRVRQDGHLDAEQRGGHRRAEQRAVALVVRVGHQGDAGRQQLGTGRVDLHPPAVRAGEGEPVVGGRLLALFQLGLGHRGPEVDIPQRGSLAGVRLAAADVPEEGPLGHAPAVVVNRGVGQPPVDREPDAAQRVFEAALVLGGQLVAQLDEIPPGNRPHFFSAVPGFAVPGFAVPGFAVPGFARPRVCRCRPGHRGSPGRTGRHSGSAPGARWAAHCHPSPSGRKRSYPACAGNGRWRPPGCSQIPCPGAESR